MLATPGNVDSISSIFLTFSLQTSWKGDDTKFSVFFKNSNPEIFLQVTLHSASRQLTTLSLISVLTSGAFSTRKAFNAGKMERPFSYFFYMRDYICYIIV
jgi:hypothetical protein